MKPIAVPLEKFGIKLTGAKLDLKQMHAEKSKAVDELTGGIRISVQEEQGRMAKGARRV